MTPWMSFELLGRAVEMVPVDAVNEAGATAADAREYLDHNEWEVTLDLLAGLHEGWRPATQWWDLLGRRRRERSPWLRSTFWSRISSVVGLPSSSPNGSN
jgi:hypothetical protein